MAPATGAASAWTLVLLWLLLLAPAPRGWSSHHLVLDLKVAYLFNFTRFVQWPEAAIGERFVVTAVGDPALLAALGELERPDKRVQGRRIRVESDAGGAAESQILFVGKAALHRLPELLRATDGRPVLVVADSPGAAKRGVAINFFLSRDILGEGERLRFEINPAALRGRGLEISAQLYDVAEIVR